MQGPRSYRSTSRDPNADKRERLRLYFASTPNVADQSNRYIAFLLGLDEGMVRKFREKERLPKLLPGSGRPADSLPDTPPRSPRPRGKRK